MRLALLGFALVLLAHPADAAPGKEPPASVWKHPERRVKVVVSGESIAAYPVGNFGAQLQKACSNIEIHNIAAARYTARDIREHFVALLDSGTLKVGAPGTEHWVLVLGGVNSVGAPEATSRELRDLFRAAHARGVGVVGLSLTPWGADSDRRFWAGAKGLRMLASCKKFVDFVLGRSSPETALGRFADGQTKWEPGDLPDVRVDLYDSELRDRDTALRPLESTAADIDADKTIQKALAKLPEAARAVERDRLIGQAREIPRWYLKKQYHAFDSTHPNQEGHRIIALKVCAQAPATWGCDCSVLKNPPPARRK